MNKLISFALISLFALPALANASLGNPIIQIGAFNATQGKDQHINIDGLIGDQFTVSDQHAENVLLGLGYFFHGLQNNHYSLQYGLNAFYLAHTVVRGTVIQENLFSNLSYHYNITNYPIFATTKLLINTRDKNTQITFDLGIGPNIIHTSNFGETSLDGITSPDHIFSGRTSTAFSATAGLGIRWDNMLPVPVELDYRFFYLGKSNLERTNDQVINSLSTGCNFANALFFSIIV